MLWCICNTYYAGYKNVSCSVKSLLIFFFYLKISKTQKKAKNHHHNYIESVITFEFYLIPHFIMIK